MDSLSPGDISAEVQELLEKHVAEEFRLAREATDVDSHGPVMPATEVVRPTRKPRSRSTRESKTIPAAPAAQTDDDAILEFTSLEEAKAWREKIREEVMDPSVPTSFLKDTTTHVANIRAAMLDMSQAADGNRVVNGVHKRQSPAYKMISLGNYEEVVVVSASWLLFVSPPFLPQ